MKPVTLEAIPVPGLEVVVRDWASDACAEALGGVPTGISGSLHVTRHGIDIGVRGKLAASATVACDRCGQPAPLSVETEIDCLYLAPRPADAPAPESEFDEISDYDGVVIDLAHVVRESLSLERPLRVLCGDVDPEADAACLTRWRESAGAPEPAADPRLAVLKKFKPVH